jgi:hypothetical protein
MQLQGESSMRSASTSVAKTVLLGVCCVLLGCARIPATDKWLGQWTGPEGTFLRLDGGDGKYQVTIQDLDGPKTFQGRADGDQIRFDRNGVTESIHATNGVDTGMKWLTDKSNCLTIKPGEGFCRD